MGSYNEALNLSIAVASVNVRFTGDILHFNDLNVEANMQKSKSK